MNVHDHPATSSEVEGSGIRSLLLAIGTDGFDESLRSYLRELLGVDRFSATYCDANPDMPERLARSEGLGVLVRGGGTREGLILEVVFHDPRQIKDAALAELSKSGSLIMAVLEKHLELSQARAGAIHALDSVADIEACLIASGKLTQREAEVCARVLYGISSTGIALDLDVGEGTVKTYRKRAYQRLELGCERELLTWYLREWTQWRARSEQLRSLDRSGTPTYASAT